MIKKKVYKFKALFILTTLLLANKVNASNDIFDFKERLEQQEEVSVISENTMVTGNVNHIDFSFYDEERKRVIQEIVRNSILEIFFNGEDPNIDINREDYQDINFENSKIVGEVDNNFLIRLEDGRTEFVNKAYYRSLGNSNVNRVIEEIERGSVNLKQREAGQELINENNRNRESLRVRGN